MDLMYIYFFHRPLMYNKYTLHWEGHPCIKMLSDKYARNHRQFETHPYTSEQNKTQNHEYILIKHFL